MRIKEKSLGFIVSFLLGVAWASLFLGAISSFMAFYGGGNIFFAIISGLIGTLPGMIFIIVLEYFITSKEKLEELKKQTSLLQKLLEEKNNS